MAGRKGFTLIEVMVCVVIVSILSAIVYPQLQSWVRRVGFRGEVYQLVGYLNKAKMEAVKTNSFVVVDPDPDGYTVFVDNSPVPHEAGDWVRQNCEQLLVSYRLKNGVTLANNFLKKKMRFSSHPAISAGTFTLTDIYGNTMDVIVNAVGRIRVK
jgi:prepilin-type N-terminal cleavage/methylation domain-containing protein